MANTILSICVQILVFFIYNLNNVECIIVNSNIGPIKGHESLDVNSFIGIPFAHPPIGELRFASPEPILEPISNISNPYNAAIDPKLVPACPQKKKKL